MKFQNQFNRNSIHLKDFDYSDGIFFITICTLNKTSFFGKISDEEMILSDEGKILNLIWSMVSSTFDYVEIGEFVVMPNHFHAILSITKKENSNKKSPNFTEHSFIKTGGFAGEKNPMLNKNLSTIVRWFKAKCTYEIRKFNKEFSWQDKYHDHVIRDAISFQNIENYIINNPKNWNKDSLK